jgi:23S rRNA-/tRNA-specific pseudouridylate synthase
MSLSYPTPLLQRTTVNPAVTRISSSPVVTAGERKLWLFVLKPQTGKTHQLRVAMKSLGEPIQIPHTCFEKVQQQNSWA